MDNGGHNVPEEDIIRRYYKGVLRFENTYKQLADSWILFYNGFSYAPVLVSAGEGDKVFVLDNDRQNQFADIIKQAASEVNVDV